MAKLLIIITKGEVGGAQMSVLGLASGLAHRGHEVTVGFGGGNFLEDELGRRRIGTVRFRWLRRTHNPVANLLFIFELKKYLGDNRYDVVHINSSNALTGALGAKFSETRPKTVFTLRGLSLLDKNYKKNRLIKFVYLLFFKFFLRYVDVPVFVSRANLDYALRHKIVKSGHYIPNGIKQTSLNFLAKQEARGELKMLFPHAPFEIRNSKFVIGSIGRLDYAKNYEFLIREFPGILAARPDAVLAIIGEGPERKKYEKLIGYYGLNGKIFLPGKLENAARCLRAFDLFVLPSRYEGLSITLIESLAAGVPILATRVGGNPELLNHSEYQLYGLDNEAEFLGKIKVLMENENLRRELGERNMELAKNYTLNRTVEEYEKIF